MPNINLGAGIKLGIEGEGIHRRIITTPLESAIDPLNIEKNLIPNGIRFSMTESLTVTELATIIKTKFGANAYEFIKANAGFDYKVKKRNKEQFTIASYSVTYTVKANDFNPKNQDSFNLPALYFYSHYGYGYVNSITFKRSFYAMLEVKEKVEEVNLVFTANAGGVIQAVNPEAKATIERIKRETKRSTNFEIVGDINIDGLNLSQENFFEPENIRRIAEAMKNFDGGEVISWEIGNYDALRFKTDTTWQMSELYRFFEKIRECNKVASRYIDLLISTPLSQATIYKNILDSFIANRNILVNLVDHRTISQNLFYPDNRIDADTINTTIEEINITVRELRAFYGLIPLSPQNHKMPIIVKSLSSDNIVERKHKMHELEFSLVNPFSEDVNNTILFFNLLLINNSTFQRATPSSFKIKKYNPGKGKTTIANIDINPANPRGMIDISDEKKVQESFFKFWYVKPIYSEQQALRAGKNRYELEFFIEKPLPVEEFPDTITDVTSYRP